MPLDIGDIYPIRVHVYDDEGDLADTGQVSVVVTNLTTGVAEAPVVLTRTSLGTYDYDYPITAGGVFEWTATASGAIEGVWPGTFVVESATAAQGVYVSVAEAINHMRAAVSITDPDDIETLRGFCATACNAVELDLGRLIGRHTITDWFDGGCSELRLRKVPLRPGDGGTISIDTVTESGTVLTGSGYLVRRDGWKLVRGSSTSPQAWSAGIENVAVTYTALCSPIPLIVRQVTKNTIARMWQATQQTSLPYSDDVSSDAALGSTLAGLTAFDLNAYRGLKRAVLA